MENGLKIGEKLIGYGHPTWVCAEIGINANGSIDIAKELINAAIEAGADCVKFQKRTINLNYTSQELAEPRQSSFGRTNGDLKQALEFSFDDYRKIDRHCYMKFPPIPWSASAWDIESVDFLEQFNVSFHKIPSARNNDYELIEHIAKTGKPVIVSCGMATLREIDSVIKIIGENRIALMVSTSNYPTKLKDLNLKRIQRLKNLYSNIPIGYSGHEVGLYTTLCAVAMGANLIERHITLDRSMFGSDQAASIEPIGFKKLIREIGDFEIARGDDMLGMLPCEMEVARKLKRK